MSSSLGLVDFAIGVVNSVLNLPKGQVNSFWGKGGGGGGGVKLLKKCNQCCLSKNCGGLANANYRLPEGQAVKLTFFAPWIEATVKERDFRIMEWSLRKGDNNEKDILAKFHWHPLTKNTVTKCLLVLFSDGYILLFFIVIYLEIFFPKVRVLIGYFKVTWHLTMKLFPAQISQQVTLQNLWRQRVTVHCYPWMLTDDRCYNEV